MSFTKDESRRCREIHDRPQARQASRVKAEGSPDAWIKSERATQANGWNCGAPIMTAVAQEMLELADEFDGYRLDMADGITVYWGGFTPTECELISIALRSSALSRNEVG